MFSDTSEKAEGVSAPGWIYVCSFFPQKKSEERGHIQDVGEGGRGAARGFSSVSVAALRHRCSSVCMPG